MSVSGNNYEPQGMEVNSPDSPPTQSPPDQPYSDSPGLNRRRVEQARAIFNFANTQRMPPLTSLNTAQSIISTKTAFQAVSWLERRQIDLEILGSDNCVE